MPWLRTDAKRYLTPTEMNVTMSTVLINSTIEINRSYTVIVTARNSQGANLNTGGEAVYISIINQCTRAAKITWIPVNGATNVLTATINSSMTDFGNEDYSYTFSVAVLDSITVAAVVSRCSGVSGAYYNDLDLQPSLEVQTQFRKCKLKRKSAYHCW